MKKQKEKRKKKERKKKTVCKQPRLVLLRELDNISNYRRRLLLRSANNER